jgi:predicted DNA-binding transcriptional regulator YafY
MASKPEHHGRKGREHRLSLKVADLREVKRWLIGFGAEALVLKPASLRREIAAECARIARKRH